MLKRYNRLLVALYVAADLLAALAAFVLAYLLRFDSGLICRSPQGPSPPFSEYLCIAPFIALLVPLAFQIRASTGCGAAARASTTSSACSSAPSSP